MDLVAGELLGSEEDLVAGELVSSEESTCSIVGFTKISVEDELGSIAGSELIGSIDCSVASELLGSICEVGASEPIGPRVGLLKLNDGEFMGFNVDVVDNGECMGSKVGLLKVEKGEFKCSNVRDVKGEFIGSNVCLLRLVKGKLTGFKDGFLKFSTVELDPISRRSRGELSLDLNKHQY